MALLKVVTLMITMCSPDSGQCYAFEPESWESYSDSELALDWKTCNTMGEAYVAGDSEIYSSACLYHEEQLKPIKPTHNTQHQVVTK